METSMEFFDIMQNILLRFFIVDGIEKGDAFTLTK